MATLRRDNDGRELRLDGRCLVGRAPTCHFLISDARVSAEHAVFTHTVLGWRLRDLGSRNGTWINGMRVNGERALSLGDAVCFGRSKDSWVVEELEAPHALVVHRPTGKNTRVEAFGLSFANDGYLYRAAEGWVVELGGRVIVVNYEQEDQGLLLGDYEVLLPAGDSVGLGATVTVAEDFEPLSLTFRVTPDEESVAMEVSYLNRKRLIKHRSYSYLLVTLARARKEDISEMPDLPSEAGFRETKFLAEGLRTTPEQINLWVWRARRQMQDLHPDLGTLIVERRPHQGTLRIGTPHLTVTTQ